MGCCLGTTPSRPVLRHVGLCVKLTNNTSVVISHGYGEITRNGKRRRLRLENESAEGGKPWLKR